MPTLRNKDELVQELSSAPAPPDSPVVSSTPDKSAAAVIGAVLPAVISWASNIWTNRRNEELAEQQNEWNLQQWRRENAYNDPRNQIARLAAAGINPALAYANGDLMNEAASSPDMTSALGHITSPVQIDPLTAAQVRNLDSQSSLNYSNIPVNEQRAAELKQSARNLETEGNYLLATYAQRVASTLAKGKLEEGDSLERYNRLVDFIQAEFDQKRAEADKAIQGHTNLKKEYDILVERYTAAVSGQIQPV